MKKTGRVQILKKNRIYDGFLKLDETDLIHEKFDGSDSEVLHRLTLERGEASTVLIYHQEKKQYILVNQFRHPTLKFEQGWSLEIVAGAIDEGETPEESAIREVAEETGYQIDHLDFLFKFYPSPGSSTERLWLYYTEVSESQKIHQGGGKDDEHEDLEIVYLTKDQLKEMFLAGEIEDAKTIMAIQWVLLNH